MEFILEHPWRKLLLTELAENKAADPVDVDNVDWEYIDSEVAKIGTINHERVNLAEIQKRALHLLSTQSKDMRLLAHLLMTLQQSNKSIDILLALTLFADYVNEYWQVAHPQKMKLRIAQMVVKRFITSRDPFTHSSIEEERNESTIQFLRLKELWADRHNDLCNEIDKLMVSYAKPAELVEGVPATPSTPTANTAHPSSSPATSESSSRPEIHVDQTSERNWKQTLLKIAEIEFHKSIHKPISFQLRRHAAWFTINSAPPADADNKTLLPPMDNTRVKEYQSAAANATTELWQKLENTLTLFPFWLDGHQISAQIAIKLGQPAIAQAIRSEVACFLQQYPELKTRRFTDGSPFASESTLLWATAGEEKPAVSATVDQSKVWDIYQQQGLEAALEYLEQTTPAETRAQFHSQLVVAQLLQRAGCNTLARQQLENLRLQAARFTIDEWEPSFFEQCSKIADGIGKELY